MSKPKKNQASSNYVTTVRQGAIAANIFRGNTPDGFTYLFFELSRSWKSQSTNREGYSKKFYDRNADALQSVITMAAQWIQEHPDAADGQVKESPAPRLTQAA